MANNQGSQAKHGDTSKRGFASMDDAKQREIASKGGKASHGGGGQGGNQGGNNR